MPDNKTANLIIGGFVFLKFPSETKNSQPYGKEEINRNNTLSQPAKHTR
jgi:hypothetical protein